jgi:hypothetical protein
VFTNAQMGISIVANSGKSMAEVGKQRPLIANIIQMGIMQHGF